MPRTLSQPRFPRVAPSTRPKPQAALKLPPLRTGIFDEFGELIDVQTQPDPREDFARRFNEQNQASGLTARPIGADEAMEFASTGRQLSRKGGSR